MTRFFANFPWSITVMLCVLVGFAPFTPQPHLFEKAVMLADGLLTSQTDIFDLVFHGSPFALLVIKSILHFRGHRRP